MNRFLRKLATWMTVLALAAGMIGCSTTSTWDPGAPDALTIEHFTLAQNAIDAKNLQDAQAALYLLRSDVMRMRTSAPEMQLALSRLYVVTNAVDKQDWVAARKSVGVLRTYYGRPQK